MLSGKFSRKSLALVGLLAVTFALIPLLSTYAHEGGPHLRFAHLSPGSPAVDIYVNGELVVKELKYKDATDYKGVEGADFEFVIVQAGGKMADSLTAQPIKMTFKASEGRYFTLAVIGSLSDKSLDLYRFAADRGSETAATAEAHTDDHDDDHMATMAATAAATHAK
jgi:hypothetical protein